MSKGRTPPNYVPPAPPPIGDYRPGLPPVPARLRHLPVVRGYPVPWFVCRLDDGSYDFRVADARKMAQALREQRCWVCGQPLGALLAFPIGPMCAINRTNGEPPAHRECAEWSIQACPFLNHREVRRRDAGLPEEALPPAGYGIMRQPGVACLWITKRFRPFRTPDGGVLFKIGDPVEVHWYREGRPATRAEILASIESGYPILLEAAQQDGPDAVRDLEAARERMLVLLPHEEEIHDHTHP